MTAATFDPAAFRVLYPEFASATSYPDTVLQIWWGEATGWVNVNSANLDPLPDAQRQAALYMMTAHLGRIAAMLATGENQAFTVSTSTGAISITSLTPPAGDDFNFWLAATPYGLKLAALLRAQTVGGFYVGGNAALSAYRKPDGSLLGVPWWA